MCIFNFNDTKVPHYCKSLFHSVVCVSRYAVSVICKLDIHYEVKDVWFGRTVIRSKYKLTYEVAQQLFDGTSAREVRKDIPELLNSDLSLHELEQRCGIFVRLYGIHNCNHYV